MTKRKKISVMLNVLAVPALGMFVLGSVNGCQKADYWGASKTASVRDVNLRAPGDPLTKAGPAWSGPESAVVLPVGGDVSGPAVLSKVDPEYSEEARRASYSGTVVLHLVVDAFGRARDIRVVRSPGLGLDEKAIEAVSQWTFRAGDQNGQPVAVQGTIEVNFRML